MAANDRKRASPIISCRAGAYRYMRRREAIALLAGLIAGGPVIVRGDDIRRPARIGVLRASPPPPWALLGFREGMAASGYAEGRDYVLVVADGHGRLEETPALADKLVTNGVDVILTDGMRAVRAALAVTNTVPIVMGFGADPVRTGVVRSLSRPGGSVTGVTSQARDVRAKLFQILKELVPNLNRVGVVNPRADWDLFRSGDVEAAGRLSLDLVYVDLDGPDSVAEMLQTLHKENLNAAVIGATPYVSVAEREAIVAGVAEFRLPAIYQDREFVDIGGLISYGADRVESFRRAAGYAAKILAGAKPSELPVEQPVKFELVINMQTAKALGLTVPQSLLQRADEVVE